MTDTQRPQVTMLREDYAATLELLFEDFKARYKIHQYEMNILMKDISHVLNVITDKANAITDKAFYTFTDQ
tara:strand:+ start:1919 stop:2131 length:213 start_codon:yes stop_codon:yes gene_type:complete